MGRRERGEVNGKSCQIASVIDRFSATAQALPNCGALWRKEGVEKEREKEEESGEDLKQRT